MLMCTEYERRYCGAAGVIAHHKRHCFLVVQRVFHCFPETGYNMVLVRKSVCF